MTEQQIQTKIKQRYEADGWMVVKLIQCSINGLPDLLCLKNGVSLWIEVKRQGGKASELQKFRHEQLRKIGFEVLVLEA